MFNNKNNFIENKYFPIYFFIVVVIVENPGFQIWKEEKCQKWNEIKRKGFKLINFKIYNYYLTVLFCFVLFILLKYLLHT